MKKLSIFLMLVGFAMLSCNKAEVYAPRTAPTGQLEFQVPDANVPAAFVGAAQPTNDLVSARFSKATTTSPFYANGQAPITLILSSNVTTVQVNYLTTNPAAATDCPGCIARENLANLTGSGTVVYSPTIATMTYKGTVLATSAAGVTHNLEFVGLGSDGKVLVTRVFQLVLLN